ncbi:ribosomal RNA small subunit methyltransferase NEP1-like [Solanum pennellii]|uniref:Ribosomal RNA small subunit methyltransferase NEP1-like n=1 Tax=Solanum pennellii TaxID=28526 RepID=A0ABM1HED9_SOLPN|nr:ribosomal RNA small subunit methyltransferase NEP1-like [Solanum pennellii]
MTRPPLALPPSGLPFLPMEILNGAQLQKTAISCFYSYFRSVICLIFLFSDVPSISVSITAVGKREKLLRVIKNTVTQYLPLDCRKIGYSHCSEKLVDIQDYVNGVNNDTNLVFVVGAMAHGKIDKDYVEDYLSISDYPLSSAYCISMITNAMERKWKIL